MIHIKYKVKIKMNIKLNLKTIVNYELLTNKSFNNIDLTNEDDVKKLLYCSVLVNNPDKKFTYETFLQIFEAKKISKEMIDKLTIELQLIEQFNKNIQLVNNQTNTNETENVVFLKDLVSLLVVNASVDVNYVMYKMSINEINMFVEAYNNKVKQKMESDRLFTFLTVIPHIDTRKIDSPTKFYAFPWEIETEELKEKESLKDIQKEFDERMKKASELINKIDENNKEK